MLYLNSDSKIVHTQVVLTLKRPGGDWIKMKDLWAHAMTSGMKLWLSNLHVIIIFGVYNNWKKNFGGLYKLRFENFFFVKTKSKIFKNSIFANIFYQTVLFNTKYQFEMISAFIWCIYCPYWSKIIYFQKFSSWKLKILLCQMRLLWHPVLEKIWITVWFLKFS